MVSVMESYEAKTPDVPGLFLIFSGYVNSVKIIPEKRE